MTVSASEKALVPTPSRTLHTTGAAAGATISPIVPVMPVTPKATIQPVWLAARAASGAMISPTGTPISEESPANSPASTLPTPLSMKIWGSHPMTT